MCHYTSVGLPCPLPSQLLSCSVIFPVHCTVSSLALFLSSIFFSWEEGQVKRSSIRFLWPTIDCQSVPAARCRCPACPLELQARCAYLARKHPKGICSSICSCTRPCMLFSCHAYPCVHIFTAFGAHFGSFLELDPSLVVPTRPLLVVTRRDGKCPSLAPSLSPVTSSVLLSLSLSLSLSFSPCLRVQSS